MVFALLAVLLYTVFWKRVSASTPDALTSELKDVGSPEGSGGLNTLGLRHLCPSEFHFSDLCFQAEKQLRLSSVSRISEWTHLLPSEPCLSC